MLELTFTQQAWRWYCTTAAAAKPVRVPSRGWLKIEHPPAVDHIVVVPADMPCLEVLPELLGCQAQVARTGTRVAEAARPQEDAVQGCHPLHLPVEWARYG